MRFKLGFLKLEKIGIQNITIIAKKRLLIVIFEKFHETSKVWEFFDGNGIL